MRAMMKKTISSLASAKAETDTSDVLLSRHLIGIEAIRNLRANVRDSHATFGYGALVLHHVQIPTSERRLGAKLLRPSPALGTPPGFGCGSGKPVDENQNTAPLISVNVVRLVFLPRFGVASDHHDDAQGDPRVCEP